MPHHVRHRSIAVGHFIEYSLLLNCVVHSGEFFVGAQPLNLLADIGVRNAQVHAQRDGGMDLRRHVLALQFPHHVVEQFQVRVESDGLNMAVLLPAQQVAAAAQFQIQRGDFETRAQVAELAQRRQPFPRHFRKLRIRRHQQIRVSPPVRPPHAPAQLVQLRQPVALRVLNDDRIRQRNIQAVFHNRGADKYVVLMLHEAQQHAFQFGLRHLSMPHADAHLRHRVLQPHGSLVNGIHAVMNEIHLPAAEDFGLNRRLHQIFVIVRHGGLNGQPVLGRRFDHRHVAQAEHRHMQRARNGRRAHR